jgi:hypothetical protein
VIWFFLLMFFLFSWFNLFFSFFAHLIIEKKKNLKASISVFIYNKKTRDLSSLILANKEKRFQEIMDISQVQSPDYKEHGNSLKKKKHYLIITRRQYIRKSMKYSSAWLVLGRATAYRSTIISFGWYCT